MSWFPVGGCLMWVYFNWLVGFWVWVWGVLGDLVDLGCLFGLHCRFGLVMGLVGFVGFYCSYLFVLC